MATGSIAPRADTPPYSGLLPVVIVILAVADGLIHLSLDFLIFGGHFFSTGAPPAPPGRPSLPLPLNELFLLNFIGYVVLALLFSFGPRLLGRNRWLINVVMVVYVAAAFVAWLSFGRPNPHGLGYLSKAVELVLIILLVVHARLVAGSREVV